MDPLADFLEWASHYGVLGLIALGLAERLLPIIPSYGLLIALGVMSATGTWSFFTALTAVSAGSFLGAMASLYVSSKLDPERATVFLSWVSKLLGVNGARLDELIHNLRKRVVVLSVFMQMIPVVRLLSPLIAGLLRANPIHFAVATFVGIVAWSSLFMAIGFIAGCNDPTASVSLLATKTFIGVVLVEGCIAIAYQRMQRKSRNPNQGVSGSRR